MRLLFLICLLIVTIPAYSANQLDKVISTAAEYSRSTDPNKIKIETCYINDCVKLARILYKQKEYTFALQFFERAHELDDKNKAPLSSLSTIFRKGLGVDVDLIKADYYAKKRKELTNKDDTDVDINTLLSDANNGNLSAQIELARLYYAGIKVEKDLTEYLKWVTAAAENNSEVWQYALALEFFKMSKGSRVTTDNVFNEKTYRPLYFSWLRKSAKNGYIKAQFQLGKDLIHENDGLTEGLFWLSVASERGHHMATQVLNFYYGQVIKSIIEKSSTSKEYHPESIFGDIINWYKHRANSNDSHAQGFLSGLYDIETLKIYDKEKSNYWKSQYLKTSLNNANNGSHLAMIELAEFFKNKKAPDLEKSLYWYNKALIFKGNNTRQEIQRIEKQLEDELKQLHN